MRHLPAGLPLELICDPRKRGFQAAGSYLGLREGGMAGSRGTGIQEADQALGHEPGEVGEDGAEFSDQHNQFGGIMELVAEVVSFSMRPENRERIAPPPAAFRLVQARRGQPMRQTMW